MPAENDYSIANTGQIKIEYTPAKLWGIKGAMSPWFCFFANLVVDIVRGLVSGWACPQISHE
jgi:hypothetical protein